MQNINELPEDEKKISLTGTNELNEEDLGLDEKENEQNGISDTIAAGMSEDESIADNDNDMMKDPDNDLDKEEVSRLFPGTDATAKSSDLEDLDESV